MNEEKFNIIKRSYATMSVEDICKVTLLGRSSVYTAIKKIAECDEEDAKYDNLYKKAGRKT